MVVVPLYDTLGADAATYIIQHTDAAFVIFLSHIFIIIFSTIIVDNEAKVKKLLELAHTMPSLKHVVLIDALEDASLKAQVQQHGIQLHNFGDLLTVDDSEVQPDVEANPGDTYIIW